MPSLAAPAVAFDHRLIEAHDYAIVNPLQVEREAWADLPAIPLVPAAHASQAHLFPLLIDLKKLSRSARLGLLERHLQWEKSTGTPLLGALLASPDETDVLGRHLCSRLCLRRPDGQADVLRFFDARVFAHLCWILDQERMSLLLGNITCWSWPESGERWRSYRHVQASPAWRLGHLRLDALMWARLGRLAETRRILDETLPLQAEDDAAALALRIDGLLARAWQRWHLDDPVDRRLYVRQALRYGEAIHHHPTLEQRLKDATNGVATYVGACAQLDERAMQRMAMETQDLREPV